jgi:ssDNA-binding Zn-finger/Zn-ribbon topoisomerase 1
VACTKVRYRTELDAKIALASTGFKKHERRAKSEQGAYRCPECGAWHLRSRRK